MGREMMDDTFYEICQDCERYAEQEKDDDLACWNDDVSVFICRRFNNYEVIIHYVKTMPGVMDGTYNKTDTICGLKRHTEEGTRLITAFPFQVTCPDCLNTDELKIEMILLKLREAK